MQCIQRASEVLQALLHKSSIYSIWRALYKSSDSDRMWFSANVWVCIKINKWRSLNYFELIQMIEKWQGFVHFCDMMKQYNIRGLLWIYETCKNSCVRNERRILCFIVLLVLKLVVSHFYFHLRITIYNSMVWVSK